MKNTFQVTVFNMNTKEVVVHSNCTSVMSNLGGVLIYTADGKQFQYDNDHVIGICNMQ